MFSLLISSQIIVYYILFVNQPTSIQGLQRTWLKISSTSEPMRERERERTKIRVIWTNAEEKQPLFWGDRPGWSGNIFTFLQIWKHRPIAKLLPNSNRTLPQLRNSAMMKGRNENWKFHGPQLSIPRYPSSPTAPLVHKFKTNN